MKRIALALVVLLVAAACGGSETASTRVRPTTSGAGTVIGTTAAAGTSASATVGVDEPTMVVREGDVIRIPWSGLDLAILEIVDSRCPSVFGGDEVCVWEGEVRTTLEFRSDGGSIEQRVLTGLHAGKGQTVYGDEHWTWFDLVEVGVDDLDADGNLTLFFSARD